MPDYATSQLGLIIEQVERARPVVTKMGTVSSRNTTGSRAMVAFDGSSGVAQPVKCPESVIVDSGDRVGLVKFESDWIVVTNYTLRTLGTSALNLYFPSGNTSGATYTDMPSSPSLSFFKVRDLTQIRIRATLSALSSATNTVIQFGVRVTAAGSVVDYDLDVRKFAFNAASSHTEFSGIVTTTGTNPAGSYTLVARWYRNTGAGTISVDGNDALSIEAQEVTI